MSNVTGFGTKIRRNVRSAVAGLVCLALGAIAQAGSASVTFQGMALDPDGSPINGSRDVVIRIYDDPVAADPANLVYRESHLGTPFLDGVFQVVIGNGSSPNDPLDAHSFSDPSRPAGRWLEVEIAGEVLAPRTQFHSVPHAMTCDVAASIDGVALDDLIRDVSAGTGLGGGGTGGNVTLFVDFSQTQRRVSSGCPAGAAIRQINADGSVACQNSPQGDITGVNVNGGLTGGGSSGDVIISIAPGGITSSTIADASITSADLAPGSVTTTDIAANTIIASDIATGAVGSAEIEDFSVGSQDVELGSLGALHIAPESLSSGNMFNEAGGDYASGDQIQALTFNDLVVRSVTIDAPSDGMAIVMASGYVSFTDPFSSDGLRCSITTGSTVDLTHLIYVTEARADDSNNLPFSATRGFAAVDGANTFNLVCDEYSGQVEVRDTSLTVIFLPTTY